jgi:hypothetical protein
MSQVYLSRSGRAGRILAFAAVVLLVLAIGGLVVGWLAARNSGAERLREDTEARTAELLTAAGVDDPRVTATLPQDVLQVTVGYAGDTEPERVVRLIWERSPFRPFRIVAEPADGTTLTRDARELDVRYGPQEDGAGAVDATDLDPEASDGVLVYSLILAPVAIGAILVALVLGVTGLVLWRTGRTRMPPGFPPPSG